LPRRGIRVCHIVSAEQWAGAEAQIAMLLRQLSSKSSLSLSAIVLGEGRLGEELKNSGIESTLIPRSSGRFLATFQQSSQFLRTTSVDILHSHKSKEQLLALLLAKRFGIPFLLRTQHGLPEAHTSKDAIVYRLEKMTARFASRIICVSDDLQRTLSDRVPANKLAVIRNAIDLEKVHSGFTSAEAKMRLGINPQSHVAGIVGRLETVKRVDIFLEAARILSRELPYACFVIAGIGREEAALRNSVRGSDLEQRVYFLGERQDIYDVMRAMDLLLITSDHEGLPTVLLEAMALGVPVVARKVGGISEVIRDHVSGRLINSADAATIAAASLQLLTNANVLRSRLITEGMKEAQHFSAEQNAASYMHMYQSMFCSL
jgi:glycosyltransferase involved in cell wall biosynthesis